MIFEGNYMNVDVSYPLDTLSWPLKVKVKLEGQGQISNNVFFRNSTLLFSVVYCKLLKQLGMSQISFEMLLRTNYIPKVPVKIIN